MNSLVKRLALFLFCCHFACSKEYLVQQEFTNPTITTSETNSWNSFLIFSCFTQYYKTTDSKQFMGPFDNHQGCRKSFSNLPPHWSLAVRVDLVHLQIFNGPVLSNLAVLFDQTAAPNQSFSFPYVICDIAHQYSYLSYFQYNLTNHQDDTFTFEIKNNSVHQFGMRNFFLYVDTCDASCLTCNGPTSNDCLSCPSNSTRNGNTCSCDSGYFPHLNACVSSCPDKFLKSNQGAYCIPNPCNAKCAKCDDTNTICQICSLGLYFYEGNCVSKCPPSSSLNSMTCVDFSTQLANPGYLIKNGLSSNYFGQSEILGLGIQTYNFYSDYLITSNTTTALDSFCGDSRLLGGFFLAGQKSSIAISFRNLSAHQSVRIGVSILQTMSIRGSNQYVSLLVDTVTQRTTVNNDVNPKTSICGQFQWGDSYFNVDIIIPHSSQSLDIEFINNFQKFYYEQSFGIRDLFVLVDYCPQFCSSCDSSGCTACQTGYFLVSKCTSCSSPKYFPSSSCVETCPDSFWPNSFSLKCDNCSSNCLQCDVPGTSCKVCYDSYYLQDGACVSKCSDGYFISIDLITQVKICLKCDVTCLTCDGAGPASCLSCTLPLYFQSNSKACVQKCNTNQYVNNQQTSCENCHSTCASCSSGESTACLSCSSPFNIFFKSRCLLSCPNGYSLNVTNLSCNVCQVFSSPGCQSCHPTCYICSPVGISTKQDTCLACYPSRSFASDSCSCKDSEDTRTNFYECSYQDQAVLNIFLSNQAPMMTIDFGKPILNLSQFPTQTNSHAVCETILTTISISLLGSNSSCEIAGTIIKITLDGTSQVYDGDLLYFIPGVLKFVSDPLTTIDKFLNNVVVQVAPVDTQVSFSYSQKGDSCVDYPISLSSIKGDSSRGIKIIVWSLENVDSLDSIDVAIVQVINQANSQSSTQLIIPMGILPLNLTKVIKVNYLLKNTYAGTYTFTFSIVALPSISSKIINTIPSPLFRFNSFDVLISYFIKSCDMFGNPSIVSTQNVDIFVSSPQSISISHTSQNNSQSFFGFTISEYTLQQDTNYDINIHLQESGDSSIYLDQVISFYVSSSPLIANIKGGNQLIDYRKQVKCTSILRDKDIQDDPNNQLITTTWQCLNPSDSSTCKNKNGIPILFSPNQDIQIPKRTFTPYTSIQIKLIGSKDSRSTSSSIFVIFQEFDLPSVTAIITVIDPFSQTLNLDEEILVTLDYDSSVNTDILSYSGTLTYQDETVAVISFDYVSLRFKLWDLYSNFDRSTLSLEMRFSIYNPNFFMPSIAVLQFTLNFPPSNCVFSYTKNTPSQSIALTTVFTLSMSGCQDADSPITYQFFFYNSYSQFYQELVVPQIVTRKQITDIQSDSLTKTVLPSGNLVLIGLAIDSKSAVFNTTLNITVNDIPLSESSYQQLIQQYLLPDGKNTAQYISQLSILSQDLSSKIQFASSAINSQKIQIVSALQVSASLLPLSSMFSSVADKAMNSLIASGISYPQSQQQSLLQAMQDSLNSLLPSSFSKIQRELKKQQLTDYFQRINSLTANSNLNSTKNLSELQLSVLNKIGDLLNSNSLPNEGQFTIQEKELVLKTQVITEKNLCGYYKCSQEEFFNASSAQTSAQTNIYTSTLQQFKIDPFYQDTSLQNYTNTLRQYTNETLVSYPIIIPSIKQNGIIANVSKPLALEYPDQISSTNKTSLTCLSRNSSTWTTNNCQPVLFSKYKLLQCFCQELHPTTIVDDLQNLIFNKNLQTAFSSQGLSNISNWTNFYAYVAFWVLLTETTLFISLLIKGRLMDKMNVSLMGNKQSSKVQPMLPEKELNTNNQPKIAKESILKVKKQRRLKQNDPPTQTKTVSQIDEDSETKNPQIQADEEVMSISKNQLQLFSLQTNVEIAEQGIGLVNSLSQKSDSLKEGKEIVKDSKTRILENSPPQIEDTKEILEKAETEQQKLINKQKLDQFNSFSFLKQVLVFHNFFNIFYIYDSKLSRPFRFALFYVRMIHSLAISIVYSAQYNQTQMIILSIFNSIIIAIVLKLLEFLSNIRKAGKIISSIFSLTILMFYYYIVLSIVSGQDYGESNQAMISYSILFLMDLLVVSVMISIGLRYTARYFLVHWEKQKYWRQIFDFLRLQLILQETTNL